MKAVHLRQAGGETRVWQHEGGPGVVIQDASAAQGRGEHLPSRRCQALGIVDHARFGAARQPEHGLGEIPAPRLGGRILERGPPKTIRPGST